MLLPTTMKAAIIESYGGSEVLQYKDVSTPSIRPDEILVRVHSAGVSPFDLHIRDGLFKESPNYTLPMILGWELSGVVAAIGKEVTQFKEGDAIFSYPSGYRNGSAYAEYAAIKESEAAHKPASITHHQATAASMNALTAWQALFDVAGLYTGQKVLIHAAAGGVGHLAVQLAKWKGAYVIGTASLRNKAFLLDLGVDEFIDYTTVPIEKAVKDVDVVLDAIGGDTLVKSFPVVKKGGTVVSMIDFERIKEASNFGIQGKNVLAVPNPQQLSAIGNLLEKGILKPHVDMVFPLAEAAKAHQLVQAGHTRGKVVLEI